MFNLKRKVAKVIKSVQNSNKSEQDIIAEIHKEFDSSTDRLLKEANEILNKEVSTAKGEELSKLGFVRSKAAIETKEIISTKQEKEVIAKHIQYYQQYYPFNKFITEKEVESICKKYGLLFGESEYYTGDVPDKNLKEISSFKLRDEECTQHRCHWFKADMTTGHGYRYFMECRKGEGSYGWVESSRWSYQLHGISNEEQDFHYEKPLFKICASVKDFDMTQMRVTDGYKLDKNIPDPVVLQPVKGGYLIVSKWGLEASDELLVNEINN